MGHLFISYSRRDAEFVRRLNDALKARGRDVWVDWESILPAADWSKEIQTAIDVADAVVFVISPDSAASRECGKEIDHAVARHKRLVPIVYRDTPTADLSPSVTSHNWIFFRDGDDFDKALDALIAAADTDLEWVHAHTRLLTRALEWDARGRDTSFALVGSDLRASERRLEQAGEKQPRLTALQVEYVLASRRAATRRMLIARGAATVALCAFVVLSLVAWGIERQGRLFLARDLHARAVAALADRDTLTAQVLLAKSLTLEDRPETRERFLEARLGGSQLEWAGPPPPTPQDSRVAAISPDGARFVIAEGGGGATALRVWDTARRTELFRLPVPGGGGPGGELQVRFSPDGTRIAAAGAHRDGRLRVWDAATGKTLGSLPVGRDADIQGLAFSPDAKTLATAGSDRTVRLWDVASATPRRTLAGFGEQVIAVAFSPDGATLACGGWDQDVTLWSAATGRRMRTLPGHEAQVTAVAFSRDGALLASAGWDGKVWLWDARTGQRLRPLLGHRSGVVSVAFSPDGRRIASGSANGMARVWDVDTGQNLIALRGHGRYVQAVAFWPGGRRLVTGDAQGGVRVWSATRLENEREQSALRGHGGPATTVDFQPGGGLLASGGQDRTVRLWDADTGRAARVLRGHPGGVFCLAFSPDGRLLASGGRG
ncbi:MAG TPA: TIR domain-containing protein, partial [Armatimonadaceae bacterium]|nr:TIR domain-containing protein [Armatimonadaceae bacterium]